MDWSLDFLEENDSKCVVDDIVGEPVHKLSDYLQKKEIISYGSILFVGIVLFIVMYSYKESHQIHVLEYLVILISVVYDCILTAFWKRQKNKAISAAIELETQRLSLKSFENMIDDICAKQHDFDNHINTILCQHYLCDDYETLVKRQREYITDVHMENRYNKVLTSGNSVVVGFLYGKFLEFDKQGIEIDYQLRFHSLTCEMPDFKLVSVLGNLLDNAAEAIKNRDRKRSIRIIILEEETKILVQIENESDRIEQNEIVDFFQKNYSSKGKHRGYGLYNVKRICEEYHADLFCENVCRNESYYLVFRIEIKKTQIHNQIDY